MKDDKKRRIEDAANRLFFGSDIDEISIIDITNEAKIAKGTFYLYYKDKDELIHTIIMRKMIHILHGCLASAKIRSEETKRAWNLCFCEALIEFYKKNPHILKFIHQHADIKHFKHYVQNETSSEYHELVMEYIQACLSDSSNVKEAHIKLSLMLRIIVEVCYSAIFFEEPTGVDEVKEYLLHLISALSAYQRGEKHVI